MNKTIYQKQYPSVDDIVYRKKRFLEEARYMAALQKNKNIPYVFAYFEENGTAYIVMELLRGETLKQYMDEILENRQRELLKEGYQPKMLAVDEFAIHKGHSYATCVMDLESGEVLWVGRGRAMADLEYFFREMDPEVLSSVVAVAMDMNASYNNLVEKYLPNAAIVYDRYHMQAQYGKDVLGVVRLAEARKHKEAAKQLQEKGQEDKAVRRQTRQKIKQKQEQYSKLKKSRWTLLMNGAHLSKEGQTHLDNI